MRRRELLRMLPPFPGHHHASVAGLNMQGATTQAVAKAPGTGARRNSARAARLRAGKARAEALRGMAERLNEPSVANFTFAVIQAGMGMNLGPVLQAQPISCPNAMRAEKLRWKRP